MVRRDTDFSRLQHTIFNQPVFWSTACQGCVRGYIQSDNDLYSDVICRGTWSCATCRLLSRWRTLRKMNRREAINAGIAKFGFKETQENQQKVVEVFIGGQDVWMVAQTGSGKGLMFHIAPLVLDFYKNGEWNLADRVCLVSFPLVWLMKDPVSILHEKVLGTETSKRENKDASKGKFNLVFTSPKALFGSHRSSILALKNKFQCGNMVSFFLIISIRIHHGIQTIQSFEDCLFHQTTSGRHRLSNTYVTPSFSCQQYANWIKYSADGTSRLSISHFRSRLVN